MVHDLPPMTHRHHEGEEDVGQERHTLCHTARDDGSSSRTESPLEEPVQRSCCWLKLTSNKNGQVTCVEKTLQKSKKSHTLEHSRLKTIAQHKRKSVHFAGNG